MLIQSSTTSSGRASRLFSYLLAALAFGGASMFTAACGDSNTTGSGGDGGSGAEGGNGGSGGDGCVGGVIVDGVCEGKCTPDKCLAENTCVGNRCVLKCDSHRDCYPDGSQECASAVEDDTGAAVNVCTFTGKPAGVGTACPFKTECSAWLACPDGGTCFSWQCNGDVNQCALDEAACEGVENCVYGKCTGDGAPCRVGCQTQCAAWLDCETAGEADANAHCVNRDCESDADCLGGYYCGIVRDPHEICGSNPKKGNNNFCGKTNEPCIAVGADGKATDGSSRFEGSICMLRRSCMKRLQDEPCATDLDCSLADGQKCVPYAGETRCTQACAQNSDCTPDHTCDLSLLACVPKFSKWVSDGGGFCEPCVSDEDCGSKGTTWSCLELSGGMRGCFDQAFPNTCNSNADCPLSPGGKPGTCLDEGEGVGPNDSVYKRCYVPINANTNKSSCW